MVKATGSKGGSRAPFIVTRVALAKLLQWNPGTLTNLVSQGLPCERTGGGRGHPTTFDLAKVLPWLFNRRASEFENERARLARLQGDRVVLELRARKGELVEADQVERRWASMVAATRERLLAIPATALQRKLITPEAEDALIDLVHDALSELARKT